MEIKTLEGADLNEILKVFNRSFSDYFIPFKLTHDQLKSKMYADKTDLKLSVGAYENGNLISFILHGLDAVNNQKFAYNGGTGVIPEKRGSGLTKRMYRFNMPLLVEKGVKKIVLEVIHNNVQAIKSYEKSGFITKRKLVCYKGEAKINRINKDLELKQLKEYDWNLMTSFWDILPSWQNSKSVMNNLKDNKLSLGAYSENRLVGYLICNPENNRMHQIAVSKENRKKGVASTLIAELIKTQGNKISIINVDKSSESANIFLNKIGLENDLEQLEMALDLMD